MESKLVCKGLEDLQNQHLGDILIDQFNKTISKHSNLKSKCCDLYILKRKNQYTLERNIYHFCTVKIPQLAKDNLHFYENQIYLSNLYLYRPPLNFKHIKFLQCIHHLNKQIHITYDLQNPTGICI
jgi:hypothetical protein